MWKCVLNLLIFRSFLVGCKEEYIIEKIAREPLPEFRKRVEEIIEDTEQTNSLSALITEDPNQNNIVSFLIQNVKEIFQDSYDSNDDVETQTKTMKEKEDLDYHVNSFSDKLEKMSNKIEEIENSGLNDFSQMVTDNPGIMSRLKTSNTSKSYYDLKLVEKQNSVRKIPMQQNFIKENEENKLTSEQENYQESTLLYRPVFQIGSSSSSPYPDTTQFYYNTRPTRLVISEFMNISQTKCTDDSKITSEHNIIPDENELFDNSGEFKIIKVDPLPFLTKRKSAERLMFLTNRKKNINASEEKETTEIITDKTTAVSPISDSEFDIKEPDPRRSCIKCDNVAVAWCSVPKHQLMPTAICPRESDICYSRHTPFGIVERGCFNVLYNLSTYVCGGNVCNYIPFIDLPMMYVSKLEWIKNVYELSHLRNMRKSTMKNLTCLKCEVNSTKFGDPNYNNNCLEGNIEVVQRVDCEEHEMCGIKSLKNQGYIWRGCVSAPLFNYYITLCDWDLCNVDPIASIYDKNE